MLQILAMKLIFITFATVISVLLQLLRSGGVYALASEMVILRTQLIALQRCRPRSPKLSPIQRLILACAAHFVPARRLRRVSIIIKPATILKFHRYLVNKKLSRLYSNKTQKKGRPPINPDIVHLVIEIKKKNPSFGCPRIAATVEDRTGVSISIESVRRILKRMNLTGPGNGPSWLTFIGTQVNSLWSVDMFRVESIILKTHWVMLVMDQYSRKIIGYSVVCGAGLSGEDVCYMFNNIVPGKSPPKILSHDNDPLFHFHRWRNNLEQMEINEIWTIPFTPTSHPFVERAIGTTRREFLDQTLFWNAADLQNKLESFRTYFNSTRVHQGISGGCPGQKYSQVARKLASPNLLVWKKFCSGLYSLPVAA